MKDQKFLQRNQLHLIKPKFRKMIEESWEKEEEVPYSVIYVSDKEPTELEIKHIRELNKVYKWEEV